MMTELTTHSVFLLRHGEIEAQQVLAGHTDFLLSKTGYTQLNNTLAGLPDMQRVFSSPLSRCLHFAEPFAMKHGISFEIIPTLKEMDFGDWDGEKIATLWQHSKINASVISIGDFWENPWENTPPNGETMLQFTTRIESWWQQFIAEPQQGNSLVVTHAGVIKYLLAHIAGINKHHHNLLNVFKVAYASCVRIDIAYDEEQRAWPSICF